MRREEEKEREKERRKEGEGKGKGRGKDSLSRQSSVFSKQFFAVRISEARISDD